MNKKTRNTVKIVLLIFVIISAAYLVADQVRSKGAAEPEQIATEQAIEPEQAPTKAVEPNVGQPAPRAKEQQSTKMIVYYFYGNIRCPTCRKLEAYTKQALDGAFFEELANGLIEWRPVNVDRPGNKHFINDYQLYTKSVIIAKFENQKRLSWKNLQKIWQLVGDERRFSDYIQTEVYDYLGAK